jgi:hypothetical protein
MSRFSPVPFPSKETPIYCMFVSSVIVAGLLPLCKYTIKLPYFVFGPEHP